MFLLVLYKSPLWKNLENKSRLLRLIILATVLYIACYSYLYSKYVETYDLINEHKSNLFYLPAVDFVLTLLASFFNSDTSKKKKNKNKKKQMMLPPWAIGLPHQLPNQLPNQFPQFKLKPSGLPIQPKPIQPKPIQPKPIQPKLGPGQHKPTQQQKPQPIQPVQPVQLDQEDDSIPVYHKSSDKENISNGLNNEVETDCDIPIYGDTSEVQ